MGMVAALLIALVILGAYSWGVYYLHHKRTPRDRQLGRNQASGGTQSYSGQL